MDVKPAAAGPAVKGDDPRQANLAQEDPLVQPVITRPHNTLHQRLSVGHAGEKGVKLPGSCSRHPTNSGWPWQPLRPMMSSRNTDATNPPNPNEFLPHRPGGSHAP